MLDLNPVNYFIKVAIIIFIHFCIVLIKNNVIYSFGYFDYVSKPSRTFLVDKSTLLYRYSCFMDIEEFGLNGKMQQ